MLTRRLTALGVAGVLAIACSGCSGSGGDRAAATARVVERDFKINGPAELKTGDVGLAVHNDGPEAHELIMIRSDGNSLPMRADGLTVDEDAVEPRAVGVLEPGAAGSDRLLKLHLTPGRYELFCNMSGHFLGGMHTALVVS